MPFGGVSPKKEKKKSYRGPESMETPLGHESIFPFDKMKKHHFAKKQ